MKNRVCTLPLSLCLLLSMFSSTLKAQQNENLAWVTNEFRHIREAYLRSNALSFGIRYLYTAEKDPAIILDSVTGSVQSLKGQYRLVLDSTEIIKNERYGITLFKEDKVMYLSGPPGKNMKTDPLMMPDSAFSHIPGLQCSVHTDKIFKTISFIFPPDLQYKTIDFVMDTVSGLLVKAIYIVKTEQMTGGRAGTTPAAGLQYDEYARVEADFYNYSKEPPPGALFDEKEYFRKEGKEFKTTEKYKQYKIFTGSPDL